LLLVAIVATATALVIGLLIRKPLLPYLVRRGLVFEDRRITWFEYGVIASLACLVITPGVLIIGKEMSVNATLRNEEWFNGVEIVPNPIATQCHPGKKGESESSGRSNCTHSYNTNVKYEWEEESCTTDKDGKETCTEWTEEAYIYAPYATVEYRYRITDSLGGEYTFPGVYVANDAKPYYTNRAIPGNIPRGAPADWLEAKARFDAGDPRSITGLFDYESPVLAVRDCLLDKAFCPTTIPLIERYRKLLPDHTVNILTNPTFGESRRQAKKCSFVGVTTDEAKMHESLMRFNAALGSKYKGDMHCVFIAANLVDDPQDYFLALRAYWLSDHFGKRALAKNGVILAIGVSNGKIAWAKADTGMPRGNNVMLEQMQNHLQDKAVDPDVIFGKPKTVVVPATKQDEDDKVTVTLSSPPGVLEEVMLDKYEFKHICMECEDEDEADSVGYKGLIKRIEPSPWQKFFMILTVAGLSVALWWIVSASTFLERWRERRFTTKNRPYSYRG